MGRNPKWWRDPVLVTVLVAVVTGAWVVSSRMSSLEAAMIGRFGGMETRMSGRFGALETRMSDRFGALEARMSDRFGALETRIAALEARMDLLSGLSLAIPLAGIQLETSGN